MIFLLFKTFDINKVEKNCKDDADEESNILVDEELFHLHIRSLKS
jgi:hypothetical protein